jgi:hypothetical protein
LLKQHVRFSDHLHLSSLLFSRPFSSEITSHLSFSLTFYVWRGERERERWREKTKIDAKVRERGRIRRSISHRETGRLQLCRIFDLYVYRRIYEDSSLQDHSYLVVHEGEQIVGSIR